ncbi:hypothetical protein BDW69DRAFT_61218 [Aspergillus filifer]
MLIPLSPDGPRPGRSQTSSSSSILIICRPSLASTGTNPDSRHLLTRTKTLLEGEPLTRVESTKLIQGQSRPNYPLRTEKMKLQSVGASSSLHFVISSKPANRATWLSPIYGSHHINHRSLRPRFHGSHKICLTSFRPSSQITLSNLACLWTLLVDSRHPAVDRIGHS